MKAIFAIVVLGLQITICSSCLKKAPDTPPDLSDFDPMLPVTHTIAQLKAMNGFYYYQTGGDTSVISTDVVVTGIVTADDRTGNFYKQIVIEDSTAAIMVLLDANNLYNDYPVGRKIYIKCKGLYLGYDGGLPVLGSTPTAQLMLSNIPNDAVADHLVKAGKGHTLDPLVVDMAQVSTAYESLYNRLITITDAQFRDTDVTYAQPNSTTNRDLQDCYGSKLVLRTSNYSTFAFAILPKGRGTITGIYTVYISSVSASRTPQLLIRDTSDVRFTEARCTSGQPQPSNIISIDSLRHLFKGSQINLSNYRIGGIVTSDRSNKNIDSKNLILQSGSTGIVVRFSATHSYDIGDSLVVDISGAQLGEYNGLLEVGSLSGGATFQTSKASKISEGNMTAVIVLTIAEILNDLEKYESTLVQIFNANASGGPTFVTGSNGSKTLTDASANMTLYTATAASFAAAALPTETKTWTGIVGRYGTTIQLQLRSLDDVQ
jgi:hypothetical protein